MGTDQDDQLERRRDELRRIVYGQPGEPSPEVAAELAALEEELAVRAPDDAGSDHAGAEAAGSDAGANDAGDDDGRRRPTTGAARSTGAARRAGAARWAGSA